MQETPIAQKPSVGRIVHLLKGPEFIPEQDFLQGKNCIAALITDVYTDLKFGVEVIDVISFAPRSGGLVLVSIERNGTSKRGHLVWDWPPRV